MKRKILKTLLALFFCLNAIQCNKPQEFLKADIFTPQKQHCHGSTLVELLNGDILVTWFQGDGEKKSDDVALFGARLKKGETKWSDVFLMADVPEFPDINPVLFIDHQKTLWLIWYTLIANQWESSVLRYRKSTDYLSDGAPKWDWQDDIFVNIGGSTPEGIQPDDPFVLLLTKKWDEYYDNLSDSSLLLMNRDKAKAIEGIKKLKDATFAIAKGETFKFSAKRKQGDSTKNINLGYPLMRRIGWQTRNKPFLLDNRIIVPLYSDGFRFSLMAITDDFGKTWQYSEPLVGGGPIQPSIAIKKDNILVAYMRDKGPAPKRLLTSYSTDKGLTWSNVMDSEIPNPGSAADIVTLKNGHWLLICNDMENGRYRLAVIVSTDEGKTWSHKNNIEEFAKSDGVSAHYPAIVQGSDGLIHICYTFNNGKGNKTIRYSRFSEEWLTQ